MLLNESSGIKAHRERESESEREREERESEYKTFDCCFFDTFCFMTEQTREARHSLRHFVQTLTVVEKL